MAAAKKQGVSGAVLISVRDFASRMGISTSTAKKLCYARTVATVKFNKSLLVPAAEVDRLIQRHIRPAQESGEVV
jgi:hypothetical protein